MQINKKEIASYALLPQVFPRFRDLFTSGFSWLAYLIAHIYHAVRLLPTGHPYLRSENQGKYGIRHVIAAAAGNLKLGWKYIDQLLIFTVIIAGVVLLFAQIIFLLFGFIFSRANAGLFETANPQSDNAFMLLDYVFGIPGFFGSCALGDSTGGTIAPCTNIPTFGDTPVYAFHSGLHALLEFYSWALLFVGILIFLYFIVVILAETASTGVPFGARFNTAWGPIRLLVAIGLLIPVVYGLNSGQYLTLAIAKMGSGLATNGWLAYNDTIASQGFDNPNPTGMHPGGGSGNIALLPEPKLPDLTPYIAAMQIIRACEYAYMKRWGRTGDTFTHDGVTYKAERILPYLIKPGVPPVPLRDDNNSQYLDVTGATGNFQGTYKQALEFFDYGDVVITFGARTLYETAATPPEEIFPYCGKVTVPTTTAEEIINAGGDPAGAWEVQKQYFAMVMFEWAAPGRNGAFAARYGEANDTGMPEYFRPCMISAGQMGGASFTDADALTIINTKSHDFTPASCDKPPTTEERTQHFTNRESLVETQVNVAWQRLQTVPDLFELTTEVRERGWAAAGMWYNRLAGVIGREFDAVLAIPHLSQYPYVMERVKKLRGMEDLNVNLLEMYNPQEVSDDEDLTRSLGVRNADIAKTLYNVNKDWAETGVSSSNLSVMGDNNILTSVMHGIFGTRTLMSLREAEAAEIHPMAQLIAVGKDLVNSTLVNVLSSVGFSIGGAIYEASGATFSAGVSQALSGAMSSIALVGLTAGFLLYYVLPFMPFLYFFFAVGTWIKTIFEAMVGVPLWALAHIRIDREGLPGDAAANGYFLLLEIFIRPIIVVFGLIASFVIFGALVRVLHEVFDLVVDNAMGFDDTNLNVNLGVYTLTLENKRSIIDEFFFTIMYTIAVYVIGLSCFKLIDMVPNSILRWAGAGVKSFGDTYQDPAEGLTQYAAIGGYVVGERAIGGIGQAGRAMGQGMGAAGARLPSMFPDELGVIARRNAATARGRGGSGGN